MKATLIAALAALVALAGADRVAAQERALVGPDGSKKKVLVADHDGAREAAGERRRPRGAAADTLRGAARDKARAGRGARPNLRQGRAGARRGPQVDQRPRGARVRPFTPRAGRAGQDPRARILRHRIEEARGEGLDRLRLRLRRAGAGEAGPTRVRGGGEAPPARAGEGRPGRGEEAPRRGRPQRRR